MYSRKEVRKATKMAAALVILDSQAENFSLVQKLGEFILAASRYLQDPSASNQEQMVVLGRLPEITAINHQHPLL